MSSRRSHHRPYAPSIPPHHPGHFVDDKSTFEGFQSEDGGSDVDHSDSASFISSGDYYGRPPRAQVIQGRSTDRPGRVPSVPPPGTMGSTSDDYDDWQRQERDNYVYGGGGGGGGFRSHPQQNPGFYGRPAGGPSYPQSHVAGGGGGYPPAGGYAAGPLAHYNNYSGGYGGHPFAQQGYGGGAAYHQDVVPFGGYQAGYGGHAAYPPPGAMYQFGVHPPPATEIGPLKPQTPASDPEKERLKQEVAELKANMVQGKSAAAEAEKLELEAKEREREREREIERRTVERFEQLEMNRIQLEKAKQEAERSAFEKLEAERKREEERRREHEENLKRIEREARDKIERERRDDDARREAHARALKQAELEARAKIEADMRAAAEKKAEDDKRAAEVEAAFKAKLEAAEVAAKLKIEAEIKKAADEKAEADKKAAADAEWRKKLEEDAKLKAEVEARAKLEAEKEAAEKAAKEAEEKKNMEEALKKKYQEEGKLSAEAEEKKKEKPPIKFKDAVGRKFSFPFHLCQTWQGMEELIKQAFLHVEVIGPHVQQGHYDLIGPDGEIILPTVWERVIQPDSAITMHMWPMDRRPQPPPGHPLAGRAGRPMPAGVPPPHMRHGAPPPPPGFPRAGVPMGARPPPGGVPQVLADKDPGRKKTSKPKSSGGLLGLFGAPKPVKKKKKHAT